MLISTDSLSGRGCKKALSATEVPELRGWIVLPIFFLILNGSLDNLTKQSSQNTQLAFFQAHCPTSLPTFVPISTASPMQP